jgi:quercetin dioxygenase-like cupin family protein
MNRREILKLGFSTAATGLVVPALPSLLSSTNAQAAMPAFGSHRAVENSVYYNGTVFSFLADSKATGGNYAMYEVVVRQGLEPPPHTHTREDEIFYLLEGEATFKSGQVVTEAKAGDHVFQPRNNLHWFKAKTPTLRGIIIVTPGGLENAFKTRGTHATSLELPPPPAAPPTPEQIAATIKFFAENYGVIYAPPQ